MYDHQIIMLKDSGSPHRLCPWYFKVPRHRSTNLRVLKWHTIVVANLPGHGNECLRYQPKSDACFVSYPRIAGLQIFTHVPIASARGYAVISTSSCLSLLRAYNKMHTLTRIVVSIHVVGLSLPSFDSCTFLPSFDDAFHKSLRSFCGPL